MLVAGSVSTTTLLANPPSSDPTKPSYLPVNSLVFCQDGTWATYSTLGSTIANTFLSAPVILPSSSGFALLLFQARLAATLSMMPSVFPIPTLLPQPQTTPPFQVGAPASPLSVTAAYQTISALGLNLPAMANCDAQAFLGYLIANAVVSTTDSVSVAVPALGIDDSGGHACTGSASGSGSGTGVGTIS
jgi:hypothetical protein